MEKKLTYTPVTLSNGVTVWRNQFVSVQDKGELELSFVTSGVVGKHHTWLTIGCFEFEAKRDRDHERSFSKDPKTVAESDWMRTFRLGSTFKSNSKAKLYLADMLSGDFDYCQPTIMSMISTLLPPDLARSVASFFPSAPVEAVRNHPNPLLRMHIL